MLGAARTGPVRWTVLAITLLLVLTVIGYAAASAQAYVYWTNSATGTIGRANLDGTGVSQTFIAGANQPYGVAVDGQHVYWTSSGGVGAIGRANLDATGVTQSLISASGTPRGLAVDDRYIYWAVSGSNSVGRANLDGTGANSSWVSTSGQIVPYGVAVDAQHLYWSTIGGPMIGRANLDGTNPNATFIAAASPYGPRGVAVDGQYVYWTNSGTNTIGRASLDGTVVNQSFITGAHSPFGVAVDGRYLYWTNSETGTIGRANLDGSGVNQSFITGASTPYGVAVDSGPIGTISRSTGSLAFGTQPLGVFGADQTVALSNTGHGSVQIGRATVGGTNPSDFLISADTCSAAPLAPGVSCTLSVRFGPSASTVRAATLTIGTSDPAWPLVTVALSGIGGSLPQGPPGPAGATGPAGPAGATGPRGPQGEPGTLVLVAFNAVASRSRVSVRYVLTGPARLELSVRPPRGKPVVVMRGDGRTGIGTLSWNRRLHGRRAGGGTYRLTITAVGGAQRAASTITVKLTG